MQGTWQEGGPLSLTVSHGRVCNGAEPLSNTGLVVALLFLLPREDRGFNWLGALPQVTQWQSLAGQETHSGFQPSG